MKKKIMLGSIIVILTILLIPIPLQLKDGGTVQYKAVLYTISKVHSIALIEGTGDEPEQTILEGISVEILGLEVFSNVKPTSDGTEYERDNTRTVDVPYYSGYEKAKNLKAEGIDTGILVKFGDVLYGKSFKLIDYAGGGEPIGEIDKLIDSEYVPELNGETNRAELLYALVYESSDKSLVLYYDNNYVLFEKVGALLL